MTLDECRKYLPESWLEPIRQDPLLWEIFEEHDYELEQEAVPPFLIQELRGGNMEHLRPILSLYGAPGLQLLESLKEIDAASEDTAELRLPTGQTAYAGYFFANPAIDPQEATKTAKRYLRAICQVYDVILRKLSPVGPKAGVLLLTGEEARAMRDRVHQAFIHGKPYLPELQVRDDLGDLFFDLPFQEECQELSGLLDECLYHISNDYFLSYALQWPLLRPLPIENPFRPFFDLWKMGLTPKLFRHDQIALIDC